MERTLTVDLPVEQVAKVVKRHLVPSVPVIPKRRRYRPALKAAEPASPVYSTHHRLPGGAVVDEIYKWTARVEHDQLKRRHSVPALPVSTPPDPVLQTLKEPGGFRRHFVLSRAKEHGRRPNFVTSSFVEFLCLYGHFGGEDLSDTDSSEEASSSSESLSSDEDDSTDSLEDDVEAGGPSTSRRTYNRHHHHHHHQRHQQQQQQHHPHSSNNSSNARHRHYQAIEHDLPVPAVTRNRKDYHRLDYAQLQARENMPLMSRSRPGQVLQGKATPGKAMFLLLKSFVTTGRAKKRFIFSCLKNDFV